MTLTPSRIQRRRTAGWRTPDNTVIVTRPSRYGNPFTLAMAYDLGYAQHGDVEQARKAVVGAFEEWLRGNRLMWQSEEGDRARQRLLDGLPALRGKSLACYCPEGAPCHADVLLRLAARTTTEG
jgi:hypothetical protein